jgi:hypothetical protein
MKYLSLFILVLILCAVIALGSVLPGVTAYKEGAIERVANLNRGNTVSASRYSVSGDRHGIVTVKDAVSSEVIRTFKMDDGVVVRETFLLDGGKTVAASQKDHAVFWDLDTGKEIRRFPQRIYGFSHNENIFFTYHSQKVFLYSYPDLTSICLLSDRTAGPESFHFSPDNRFLAIRFITGFPATDKNYPNRNHVTRGFVYTKLFNLQDCQEILEFSRMNIRRLGEFSSDFMYYDIPETFITRVSKFKKSTWRFDLTTYLIQDTGI